MLYEMKISGGACFGREPLCISGLQPINFIFGPNGSGKTTISRAFAGHERLQLDPEWTGGQAMDVRVYNKDFVDGVLHESTRIPGVFVLGENSAIAQSRLEEIEGKGGEREQANIQLERDTRSHENAKSRQADARNDLKEIFWEKYKAFHKEAPALLPAFQGFVGNKEKALDKVLEIAARTEGSEPVVLEDLLADASAVFATDATEATELPQLSSFKPNDYPGYAHLEEKVVGSSDVSLSELVNELGNSDWVSTGYKDYLPHSKGLCPFCQQPAPSDLAQKLAAMFDDSYEDKRQEIDTFVRQFKDWASNIEFAEEDYDTDSKVYLDAPRYQKAREDLLDAIRTNNRKLEKKQETASHIVTFKPVDKLLAELNQVLTEANEKIQAHNSLVRNQKQARPELVQRCWRYVVDTLVADDLARYHKKVDGLQKGVDITMHGQALAENTLFDLDREIAQLQRSVESTKPVIDEINALLRRAGFTSFEIVNSPELEDGYMLARDGVELHEHSLSEGERTFIAFLYYYHSLKARHDSKSPHRILSVIDDPISSLDSDILFIVSTLVRDLIARAHHGLERIAQIVVLTHNVYFHKQVTHRRQGDPGIDRAYFLIRKKLDAPNEVEPHGVENPISTEYERLWGEVRRAIDGETVSVVGLENVLRRILENYFRILGDGIWEDDIAPLLSSAERPVLHALFSWVNEGSHGILEEIYHSPSTEEQDTYLQVFRRIFEETDQLPHYNLMLHGKNILQSASITASS